MFRTVHIRKRSVLRVLSIRNVVPRPFPRPSRTYVSAAAVQSPESHEDPPNSISTGPRLNPLGIQLLPPNVHAQLFLPPKPPSPDLIALSKSHLTRHNLNTPASISPSIHLDLPPLHGSTLDEHFHRLGLLSSTPYLRFAREFALLDLPPAPSQWIHRSGWTKYHADGWPEPVATPEEEMLVFDIEVLYKISPFAVMACAASPHTWYAWISPWVLGETENDRCLIPLGNPEKARIVIGHNVGFDRSRVQEEYALRQTKTSYLDTMSMHAAVNGMGSRQKSAWMKHKKEQQAAVGTEEVVEGEDQGASGTKEAVERGNQEASEQESQAEEEKGGDEMWIQRTSLNSLKHVAQFHCGIEMDKTIRDQFGILDPAGVREQLSSLLTYCADDVAITHKVYRKVLPAFLDVCPHPVSFAALRHISSATLPVDRSWETYISNAEATYHRLSAAVIDRLAKLAEDAVNLRHSPEIYTNDPWLRQLDWSAREVKMVKGKHKKEPPRPSATQKLPGMPKWYKDLFMTKDSPISLTVRTRVAPLLLRMMWDGNPLVWSNQYGWTFRVEKGNKKYNNAPILNCDMSTESNVALKNDKDGIYFKIPHRLGSRFRCYSPLAKSYLQYFEDGTLSSEFSLAKEALEMNASCSYWISARERISDQMVVWESETKMGLTTTTGESPEVGIILPRIIPMGTITRRAVESTWLTAPQATPRRVGSELKAMVKAPPGYVFVGADVDSEELWIASLVGDAVFGLHGGNALGFMNLEGTKANKTDMHSKTASILGISRDAAKVFNYGRIYGGSVGFAASMLREYNRHIPSDKARKIAEKLYNETKGRRTARKKIRPRPFWRGGTESFVFNKLEEFTDQENPRTPVLGAGITEALMRANLAPSEFMPSRINWAIQSSGVDYLHLLIVSMDYLTRRYNIDARLSITVHDEVRYLVKEVDRYRCAMALQIANLWTRAMFSQQMGIDDLPQSVAYFSTVDIDHVLRKDVDMPCITPSHPEVIPPGESLDITSLLSKSEAHLDPEVVPREDVDVGRWEYTPREPIMKVGEPSLLYVRAQISSSNGELKEIMDELKKEKEKEKERMTKEGEERKPRRGRKSKEAKEGEEGKKPRKSKRSKEGKESEEEKKPKKSMRSKEGEEDEEGKKPRKSKRSKEGGQERKPRSKKSKESELGRKPGSKESGQEKKNEERLGAEVEVPDQVPKVGKIYPRLMAAGMGERFC